MIPGQSLHRRTEDAYGVVTNADLYHAIEKLQDRMAKLEQKMSYLFGGFGVVSVCLAAIEIVTHHAI